MIDPQGQANRWIRNMERDRGLDVVKPVDKDLLRTLENGVRFGRAVLLENVGESLDAALESLLLKQTFRTASGAESIKIGDNIIPYHPDFKFYVTTRLRNPHYAPEVAVKVSLLNFFVTREGLEEQLLGTVVANERPDLASMKSQLVVSNARMKKELKDIEDKILHMLSNSQVLCRRLLLPPLHHHACPCSSVRETFKLMLRFKREFPLQLTGKFSMSWSSDVRAQYDRLHLIIFHLLPVDWEHLSLTPILQYHS
jgi:hypothetical protein